MLRYNSETEYDKIKMNKKICGHLYKKGERICILICMCSYI